MGPAPRMPLSDNTGDAPFAPEVDAAPIGHGVADRRTQGRRGDAQNRAIA
jgi:hypothetical protein